MQIIDISITMRSHMHGIAQNTSHTLADNGWNTRTLHLYSYATNHMDAPCHFFEQDQSIEHLELAKCVGPIWVIDFGVLKPRELITVKHLRDIEPNWSHAPAPCLESAHRYPDPSRRVAVYRFMSNPFFSERPIALIGIEQPSFKAVNDIEEITIIHKTLRQADIVITERLTNLEFLREKSIFFTALPLKIEGGNRTLVRAIAIENSMDEILL